MIKNDNDNIKIEYIKFQDLENISNNEIETLIDQLLNLTIETDWLIQYESINFLRRLNKYNKLKFEQIFDKLSQLIVKLSSSIRSNISKVILLLISEIFFCDNFIGRWVKILIPAVLFQSASNKGFIKEEALICLDNISKSKTNHEYVIICTLSEEIMNKNPVISENSLNCLINFLKQCDINLSRNEWNDIIMKNINIYNLKKDIYSKKAIRLLNVYLTILGDTITLLELKPDIINIIEKMKKESIKSKIK